MRRRPVCPPVPVSEFTGFQFPPEMIVLAVRCYLRYATELRNSDFGL
ncbi:hypothetical protein [Candidatus Protofrankia californiensis]